jgi:hypothetical protein
MSLETFQACLATVPREVEIHFLGMAEPWLNPACTRMVRHAHRRGHRLSVSTTLAGMGPGDVDAIAAIPFDAFIIHVPSDDGQMNLTVDSAYVELLEQICRSGVANLKYKRFGPMPRRLQPILSSVPEAVWPTLSRANNLAPEIIAPNTKVSGRIRCHRIRNNVLLPNGEVALCCNDYGLQHILGNLLTDTYGALFKSAAFRRVRAGLADPAAEILCRHCRQPCMKIDRQPAPAHPPVAGS